MTREGSKDRKKQTKKQDVKRLGFKVAYTKGDYYSDETHDKVRRNPVLKFKK